MWRGWRPASLEYLGNRGARHAMTQVSERPVEFAYSPTTGFSEAILTTKARTSA
jgi:hypothetical protein